MQRVWVLTEQPQWHRRSLAQYLVELHQMSISCMRHTTTSQRHCIIIVVVHLNMYIHIYSNAVHLWSECWLSIFPDSYRGNSYMYVYTLSQIIVCNEAQYYTTYNVVYTHIKSKQTVHVLSACMCVCCMWVYILYCVWVWVWVPVYNVYKL